MLQLCRNLSSENKKKTSEMSVRVNSLNFARTHFQASFERRISGMIMFMICNWYSLGHIFCCCYYHYIFLILFEYFICNALIHLRARINISIFAPFHCILFTFVSIVFCFQFVKSALLCTIDCHIRTKFNCVSINQRLKVYKWMSERETENFIWIDADLQQRIVKMKNISTTQL